MAFPFPEMQPQKSSSLLPEPSQNVTSTREEERAAPFVRKVQSKKRRSFWTMIKRLQFTKKDSLRQRAVTTPQHPPERKQQFSIVEEDHEEVQDIKNQDDDQEERASVRSLQNEEGVIVLPEPSQNVTSTREEERAAPFVRKGKSQKRRSLSIRMKGLQFTKKDSLSQHAVTTPQHPPERKQQFSIVEEEDLEEVQDIKKQDDDQDERASARSHQNEEGVIVLPEPAQIVKTVQEEERAAPFVRTGKSQKRRSFSIMINGLEFTKKDSLSQHAVTTPQHLPERKQLFSIVEEEDLEEVQDIKKQDDDQDERASVRSLQNEEGVIVLPEPAQIVKTIQEEERAAPFVRKGKSQKRRSFSIRMKGLQFTKKDSLRQHAVTTPQHPPERKRQFNIVKEDLGEVQSIKNQDDQDEWASVRSLQNEDGVIEGLDNSS